MKRNLFVLFALFGLIGPMRCAAQPGNSIESSLDWIAIESTTIVRGTIDDMELGKYRWGVVTVSVSEVIKGEDSPNVSFRMRIGKGRLGYDEELKKLREWSTNDREILVFLVPCEQDQTDFPNKEMADIPVLEPLEFLPSIHSIFSNDDNSWNSGLKTMDSQPVIEYADIRSKTRSALVAAQENRTWDWFDIPINSLEYFRVPVNSELEALARTWLDSNDEMIQLSGLKANHLFDMTNMDHLKDLHSKASTEEGLRQFSALLDVCAYNNSRDIEFWVHCLGVTHNPTYRKKAIHKVGQLGAEAQSALPALEKLVNGEDRFLKIGAAAAISKIKGE